MRFLHRLRPQVHVAQLGVAAVEREGLFLGPGADDQFMRLVVFLPRQGRDGAVAEIGIHRRADRESGHQPPAGNAVEHGEFLGHADRRIVQRDRIAEHDDRRVLRPPRQRGGDQVRRGHQPVTILVMLVDADAVEAERVGVFEQVEVVVINLVALHRVVQPVVDIDPDGAVLLPEIVRQMRPGHQVEPREAHVEASHLLTGSIAWMARSCPATPARAPAVIVDLTLPRKRPHSDRLPRGVPQGAEIPTVRPLMGPDGAVTLKYLNRVMPAEGRGISAPTPNPVA